MVTELRTYNQSRQLYARALSSAWRYRSRITEPSLWEVRDDEVNEKLMRDADIAHAVEYRCKLVAGKTWDLLARHEGEELSDLAVSVARELLGEIEQFTVARRNLAFGFLPGQRFATIHGEPRVLRIGDDRPRTWWVPTRLEDEDKRVYQIVPDSQSETPKGHWQHWDVWNRKWVDLTRQDMVAVIKHTYNDTQETLGYGKGLREALGWLWYTKTHVFQESISAVEKFAGGIITAKIDGLRAADSALGNTQLFSDWQDILEDVRGRHVIPYDSQDQIEVIEPSGTGHEVLSTMRAELRSMCFTIIIGANLTTSADKGGSFALAEIQENSTEQIVQYDREALEETFTKDLLGCVWFKNHANMVDLGLVSEKPRFSIAQGKREVPKEHAEVAEIANRMGLPLAKDDLYEKFGLRKPEEGEEILEGQMPQPALGQPALPGFGFSR